VNPLADLASVRRARDEAGLTFADLRTESLRRIGEWEDRDPPLGAFLATAEVETEEVADLPGPREASREGGDPASGESAQPEPGPLEGVPVAVKDNLCTSVLPTTCASRALEGFRSPYAATAVRRLESVGAWIVGTTNMDEFAMGSSTENSAFGLTRNPVDPGRVPGGSSGGSAAAVAAGIVPLALGSSTGGSVRQPAAFCGVVGVKPTYGRVSRYGLVAFASSLDHVGVLAGRVRDAAEALETIAGPDPRDATCRDRPVPRAAALDGIDLEGSVLGVPREYMGEGLDPGIRGRVEEALGTAAGAGASVREISLPTTRHAIPCYYVIASAEAASNLARYDGVRYGHRADGAGEFEDLYRRTRRQGLGDEVRRRIMIGTYVLSVDHYERYYLRARRLRAAVADDFRRVFSEGVDAVLAPTTPTPAFRIGEERRDPYEMYRHDVFTVAANLAGLPAVSIPAGEVEGLPVGIQLMCPAWEEERMLGLAARLEERLGPRPPMAAPPGPR